MNNPPTTREILTLYQARRFTEAEEACQQALARNPNNAQLLLLGATIAMEVNDPNSALARLRRLAILKGAASELRYNAALLLRRLGDLQMATETLRALGAQHPGAFPVLLDLGQAEEAMGHPDAALRAYEAAITVNPGHAGPFTRRAVLMLRQRFGAPLPMPPDKQPPEGLAAGRRIAMSTLGLNGRFGNQLLQYGCLRALGAVHGLAVEAPEWIGRWLYDLNDPTLGKPLPELREEGDNIARLLTGSKDGQAALADHDLWGYCCYHTRHFRPHRELFQRLFVPGERLRPLAEAAMAKIMARGRTLVALHLRRGDFGYGKFWIAPESWYLDWLKELWPQLDAPVLFIASDDSQIHHKFAAYRPVTAADLGPVIPGAEFFYDFHALTQAEHLAISNSSFSFVAAMLDTRGRDFLRPDPTAQRLVPFDPWDAEVLLPDPTAPS